MDGNTSRPSTDGAGEAAEMAKVLADIALAASDPLEAVERVMTADSLPFERMGEEEISASFDGSWCAYRLWFAHRRDMHALHFASAFELQVPAHRRAAVHRLLSLINERLWVGHFNLWTEDGQPTWRHALLLPELRDVEDRQVADLVMLGVGECERFYPAFQQVVWAGMEPEEALTAALIEPQGVA